MKILVVGSTEYTGGKEVQGPFVEACKQLGASLAKANHTIVVGSDREQTADRHVVFGANEVEGRHKVLVIRPTSGATPFDGDRANLTKIDFSFRRSRGSWAVGRIYQIQEVDAVIMVGGGRGTAQVGYTAPALKKPVLAIAAFGGAARDTWDEYLEAEYAQLGFFDHNFFGGKLANLSERWDPSMADLVVSTTKALVERNPYRLEKEMPQTVMVVLPVLLYGAWIGLFVNPIDGWMSECFFALLIVSALLGTGLRTALRVLREVRPRISVRRVLNEGVIGLLVAFGLSLLYLAGGVTITGGMKFVSVIDKDLLEFQRIAVTMSILGFAAGLLIERAAEQLIRRLENVLTEEDQGKQ